MLFPDAVSFAEFEDVVTGGPGTASFLLFNEAMPMAVWLHLPEDAIFPLQSLSTSTQPLFNCALSKFFHPVQVSI